MFVDKWRITIITLFTCTLNISYVVTATATRVRTLNTEADNLTTLTTAEVWAYIDFSWTICFSVVRGPVVELEAYIDWCGGTEMGLQWQIICITLRETSVIYSGYVILVINFICYMVCPKFEKYWILFVFSYTF